MKKRAVRITLLLGILPVLGCAQISTRQLQGEWQNTRTGSVM